MRDTRGCNYTEWGYWISRPGCCTRHLRAVTAFTEELLTRHGILHFIDWGSLLGAVRTQTLIPWDGDTDFAVLASDFDKIMALEKEIEDAGFFLHYWGNRDLIRITRSRVNHIHADLWFHQVDDNFAWFNYLNPANSVLERHEFPLHFLQNLGTVTLEGVIHPAPVPVEQFLAEYRYGPDFMTPQRPPRFDREATGTPPTLDVQQLREIMKNVDPSSPLYQRCRGLLDT